MLKMKRLSETYDLKVFVETGDYFGDVEEVILTKSKVSGWRVRATKNSFLNKILGKVRGVIIPHQLVKAIGDIMIVSKSAVPTEVAEDNEEEQSDE